MGDLQAWRRPDERQTLYFGQCEARAYGPLAAAVGEACYTTVDAASTDVVAALVAAGFSEHRREHEYEIPVSRVGAPLPYGINVISAGDTALDELMALDCALREDVPGADGWQPDAQWFREETYDSPYFDPATYLVAQDGARYVGLARIWNGPQPLPRLGLVGVLPGYRRRGLARALVARAMAPLADRGADTFTAEADVASLPANALLTGFGGRVVGGSVELFRSR